MRLVYQWAMAGGPWEEVLAQSMEDVRLNPLDLLYVKDTMEGVQAYIDQIDSYITQMSRSWRIERMAKVDLAVLRVATYELCFRQDIPDSVAINEAVELSKRYSAPEASAFVNGILSSLVKSRDAGELKSAAQMQQASRDAQQKEQ